MFLWAISLVSLALVAVLSFMLLMPEFSGTPDVVVQEVFEAPDVKVNFGVLDSLQVRNLEPFLPSAMQGGANQGKPNPFQP